MAITINALRNLFKRETETFEKKESKPSYTITNEDKLREVRLKQLAISQDLELETKRQEVLKQQAIQQSMLQSSLLMSGISGMATNIPGQGQQTFTYRQQGYSNPQPWTSNPDQWNNTSWTVAGADEDMARQIANILRRQGVEKISNTVMSLLAKEMTGVDNSRNTPITKQPKKKLDL